MKTMTCKQLGGPENCNQEFHAESFDEIKGMSMQHGKEMFQKQDKDHLQAMQAMKEKMQDPQAMQAWLEEKKKEFDELPENNQ